MYARKIKFKIQRWNKYSFSSSCHSIGQCWSGALRAGNQNSLGGLVEKYLSERFLGRSDISWSSCSMLRSYSSEGDGRSASEDTTGNERNSDAHARLGEQDQLEWLGNEKLAREAKEESPFLTRRERFRNEFLRRVVPWEKITVSWDTFPYYIRKQTKDLLVECTASHMRNKKLVTDYGGLLNSSRGRILLQSIPGTELYRDRLVRALARDLQVPLLVLDSSVLGNQATSRGILFKWSTSGESRSSTASSNSKTIAEHSDKARRPLKKGDPVKYIGQPIVIAHQCDYLSCNDFLHVDNQRTISEGQRGEVYEVKGDQVAVILDSGKATKEGELDEKSAEPAAQPSLCWLHVKDIKHDLDCYVAMEVLFEVLESQQPVIVYFPDSSLWLSRAVSKSNRKEFVRKLQEMFDRLSGPVVLICGQNKVAAKEKDKLPLPLRRLTEGLKATNQSGNVEICQLFTNVLSLSPPKEEDLLRIFIKQIEEDWRIVLSRRNLYEMHKVLEMHGLSCMDLLHVNTDGLILTKHKAEKLVGWAKNHYLSSCLDHSVEGDRLQLPRDSLELAISRLKVEETGLREPSHSHDLKTLAEGEYEKNFISAVVPPGEIGVRFDDVGALEDVKKVLNELVILPMQRPELFSHGNLLQPCKGILLFGPPGTGKTLIAKALATEAGANFIYVTSSTLTSMWYGDEEKLAAALFSFASKLAPVIIFVDEVDSLLGARGDASEHEATRRLRNEFMASWDGLRSKDSQRILILGATNRPFDLDDAVIRRLPRRIYVDLPDAENRLKILKIILARENLVSGFSFEQLVNDTDGYSGSDLKNLCIAAAYRPVQELIEEEKNKNARFDGVPGLRPLSLDDFICSKAQVGPSVAYDSGSMNELRKWNDQYGEGGSRTKLPFGF